MYFPYIYNMKQKKKESAEGSLADRMSSAGIGRGANTSKKINWSKIKKVSSNDAADDLSINYKDNIQMEIANSWNGYCPESLLQGKKIKMRLNQWDFYESEETGLQICVLDGFFAVILSFRGEGKFHSTISYGHEIAKDQLLCPQNIDRFPFNDPTSVFKESEEINNYIENIKK